MHARQAGFAQRAISHCAEHVLWHFMMKIPPFSYHYVNKDDDLNIFSLCFKFSQANSTRQNQLIEDELMIDRSVDWSTVRSRILSQNWSDDEKRLVCVWYARIPPQHHCHQRVQRAIRGWYNFRVIFSHEYFSPEKWGKKWHSRENSGWDPHLPHARKCIQTNYFDDWTHISLPHNVYKSYAKG